MIYIYGLKCPVANVIRYIGKSNNPSRRLRRHISQARTVKEKHHAAHWIRQLISSGLEPELVILRCINPGEKWQDIEREFISKAGDYGWRLTNSTDGGEGVEWTNQEDYERHMAKVSAQMKEFYNRPENRLKRSMESKALWSNPDYRDRAISSIRARCSTPEHRAKLSKVGTVSHAGAEYKAEASVRAKAQWSDPAKKARMQAAFAAAEPKRIESLRATIETPEYRAMRHAVNAEIAARPEVSVAKSESMKAHYADPIRGAQHRAVMASPEFRKKASVAAKRRSTPEYRAGMSVRAKEVTARPEYKAEKSRAMKEWWTNPSNAERLSLSMSKRLLEIDGRTMTISQWSGESGVRRSTILARIDKGMDLRSAVFTPVAANKSASAIKSRLRAESPAYRAMMAEKTRASWEKRRKK